MSRAASRNTAWALINATEMDLRQLFVQLDSLYKEGFLPSDVRGVALKRYGLDRGEIDFEDDVEDFYLLNYLDFADLGKLLDKYAAEIEPQAPNSIRSLSKELYGLVQCRNGLAHGRDIDFLEFPKLVDFARAVCQLRITGFNARNLREVLELSEKEPDRFLNISVPEFWGDAKSSVRHNLPQPEFLETGFLGRQQDRLKLLKNLKSSHPVNTIVGEGGVGKTALALKCAYDLVDDENCPFKSIVWFSSKTKNLSPGGVIEIRNAISTTLGLYQVIGEQIGARGLFPKTSDLLTEIRSCMEKLPTLLIIDNLETLEGEDLRDFLVDIPLGSKVLITSRMGLGELEYRFALGPLDKKAAIELMRSYAGALNLSLVLRYSEQILEGFGGKLFMNPLLIRWFISSVALGADPNSLLDREASKYQDAVSYCFQNLFDRLTQNEREVVQSLQCVRNPVSTTEIKFLHDKLDPIEIEDALQGLVRSNLVFRSSAPNDQTTLFSVGPTAAEYIDIFARPSSELFSIIDRKKQELIAERDNQSRKKAVYKYDVNRVQIKSGSNDELIAGLSLRKALDASYQRDLIVARQEVLKSKQLMPRWAEPYRISALIESYHKENYNAGIEYEKALEMSPNDPLILFSYANFLDRNQQDFERALKVVDFILEVQEPDKILQGFRARMLSRLNEYELAAELFEMVLKQPEGGESELVERKRLMLVDAAAENFRRWAEVGILRKEKKFIIERLNNSLSYLEPEFQYFTKDPQLQKRYLKVIDEALLVACDWEDKEFAAWSIVKINLLAKANTGGSTYLELENKFREVFIDKADVLEAFDRSLQELRGFKDPSN